MTCQEETEMNKVRLGIIGIGNMGTGHAENILSGLCPEIVLTAAADRRASRRAWVKEHIPGAAVFTEGEELIASGQCDAVLIAVPHYQHPGLAISAFRHGLHAMVEKPAGVYTLQVREMIAEADRHPELGQLQKQTQVCRSKHKQSKKSAVEQGKSGLSASLFCSVLFTRNL